MPLLELLKERSFDAEAVKAMGEAYDKARQKLHDRGQSPTAAAVREIVAERIIEAAVSGRAQP